MICLKVATYLYVLNHLRVRPKKGLCTRKKCQRDFITQTWVIDNHQSLLISYRTKLQSQSHLFLLKKKNGDVQRGKRLQCTSILFTDLLYPYLEIAGRTQEI